MQRGLYKLRSGSLFCIVTLYGCQGNQEAKPPEPSSKKETEPDENKKMDLLANSLENAAEPLLAGTYLDEEDNSYRPISSLETKSRKRTKMESIGLLLRSTPPGAIISIDGAPHGVTPTFWKTPADGKEHEYTFSKNGFSVARYRFVAVQSGIVHGTLSPLIPTILLDPPKHAPK